MRSSCVARSVSLPARRESGTDSTERENRTAVKLKLDCKTKSRAAASCRVTVCGFEATVTSTGQHDIRPPGTGLWLSCFAGALLPE